MAASPDTVFAIANGLALPAWLALAASPPSVRWTPWTWRITGRVLPLAYAIAYVVLLLTAPSAEGGGFGSIAQVRALFAVDAALTAGWIHYLAFDLFVGPWIAQRAAGLGLPHLAVIPLLALTFLFGPAGLLAFFALRAVLRPASLRPSYGATR
ncbi:MAG: abscisic acid-deficient protein Aba4 family protein [Burkholderiales bacterium]